MSVFVVGENHSSSGFAEILEDLSSVSSSGLDQLIESAKKILTCSRKKTFSSKYSSRGVRVFSEGGIELRKSVRGRNVIYSFVKTIYRNNKFLKYVDTVITLKKTKEGLVLFRLGKLKKVAKEKMIVVIYTKPNSLSISPGAYDLFTIFMCLPVCVFSFCNLYFNRDVSVLVYALLLVPIVGLKFGKTFFDLKK
jgi:hypothetical protein